MWKPSDKARVLLVDPSGVPYSIGSGSNGVFLPSTKFRACLVDENGVEYKASGSGPSSNIAAGTDSVSPGATGHTITHNLNSTSAVLMGAYGRGWNIGSVTILTKTLNTIVISFGNEAPSFSPQPSLSLDWSVALP